MLPPGSPPSLLFSGSTERHSYAGPCGRDDRVRELLHRLVGGDRAVVLGAVVVLDLLQGEDVGRGEVVDDGLRERVELLLRVARVEVLHVVRGHGQLVLVLLVRGLALQAPVDDGAEGAGGDRVAAELVEVERALGRAGQPVADVRLGERLLGDRGQRLDLQTAGVLVLVGAVDRAAAPVAVLPGLHRDPQLGVRVGGADHARGADPDVGALEGLVVVQGVLPGVQLQAVDRALGGRVALRGVRAGHGPGGDRHRGGDRVALGEHRDDRLGELGERLVAGVQTAGDVLGDRAVQADGVADGDRRDGAGEDEEALAGGRVRVRLGVLDPESARAVRADAGDDARDAGDLLADERGDTGRALDVVDADARGVLGGGGRRTGEQTGGEGRGDDGGDRGGSRDGAAGRSRYGGRHQGTPRVLGGTAE